MSVVDETRISALGGGDEIAGPVMYVMSRDQRVHDNWALVYAQELAIERKQPLLVACPIAADYPGAPPRQISFMLHGLREVESGLTRLRIPFLSTTGPAATGLSTLVNTLGAGAIVTDFSPLRESRQWKTEVADRVKIPFFEIDAHNIVPSRAASDKLEYAAYTIRPKIKRLLDSFLVPIPALIKHPFSFQGEVRADGWSQLAGISNGKRDDSSFALCKPGEAAAQKQLQRFLSTRLQDYNERRNNPVASGQSDLSPYFHFGQLSAQRAALEAQRHDNDIASLEAFLEELIVRRELSDNFCYHNQGYDSFDGFPAWAQKTLNEHRSDPRTFLYNRDTLEAAETHDDLWNAAQTEMVVTGKMHGYMRMYWAKKILEWTTSPEAAMAYAIHLNNTWELDGHDPNGYAGIAWSIGGVHDRAWSEREIFGKIRYMSFGGCKRKFPVADYINRMAIKKAEAAG